MDINWEGGIVLMLIIGVCWVAYQKYYGKGKK